MTRPNITIPMIRLSADAKVPTYAHASDSGADVYAPRDVVIQPDEQIVVWLDIAIELPVGFEAQMRPRSSMIKLGLWSTVCTIDQGYRGNIGLVIWNKTDVAQALVKGQRIAQMVFQQVPYASFVEVAGLQKSDRGTGGFGSSGK